MKIILAAFALAIAAPAAAQPPAPADHSQHREHGQQDRHHPGHGQHREGQGHDCPCCRPDADGRRPACCERMMQQHRSGEQDGHQGHDSH